MRFSKRRWLAAAGACVLQLSASGALGKGSGKQPLPEVTDECLKDFDCPSDQICEAGQCMISNGPGTPSVRPQASFAKPNEDAPKGAVLVSFTPSDTSQRWTVEAGHNERVCDLPCALWVAPMSGLKLRMQADRPELVQVLPVPDSLGFSAGDKVRAVAIPAHKGISPLVFAGIPLAIGGAALLGVGLGFATKNCFNDPSASGCDSANPGKHSSTGAILAGLGGAFALTGLLLVLMPGGNQAAKLDVTRSAKLAADPKIALTADGFAVTF